MSHSPDEARRVSGTPYEAGWITVHRMLRNGASWSGRERHCAFLGAGDGTFADASAVTGLDLLEDGRAAVATDWDGDGGLDLWIASRTGPRLRLMRNAFASGARALELALEQEGANRDAVGARLDLVLADGRVLTRSLRAGFGYLAQGSLRAHFGLTGLAAPETLRVRWPDGETREYPAPAPGRWVLARDGALRTLPGGPGRSRLDTRPLEPHVPTEKAHVSLAARLPMPELRATVAGGVPRELLAHHAGRPLLVLPWASWCAPCLEELRALVEARDELAAAGLTVVALNADTDDAGRRAALRFLREVRWPFETAEADAALLDVLDLVQQYVLERRRRLALPSAFLIDREGRLAVLTKGPLEPRRLVLDTLALDRDPVAVRAAAVPFPGLWRGEPLEADALGLETRLRQAGFEDVAQAYYRRWFREEVEADVGVAMTHLRFGLVLMQQRDLRAAAEHLYTAVELDPTLTEAWANLAAVLHKQGNRTRAIEAYERALALAPDHVPARFNLGLALAESGDPARAREEAARLEELVPELAERLRAEIAKLESSGR